ncbi:glucosamine-6-phosphate deaminase [Actinokineospora baliensis]|uniref:glucosamine-6-phosphate deaminase n=1 Tax=Actinokineospora baliensis TaxID=547056 RepID=UPI001957E606|nr:glucosamine-6-phosphate deaminase [Actinokineospora baliensis]MBM7775036.1 glucosamine-6-phosphate deaminase [Actinokineospora baliensis]
MEIVIVADRDAVGEVAAGAIADLVSAKPDALVGVATGSSPLPVYASLARRVAAGELDVSRTRVCQLDEYVGLPTGHPESYRAVIEREVLTPLGLTTDSFLGPDGAADDLPAACADYERVLREAGGVDLQLLGIGSDGHIGFNEPCSSFSSRTRVKTLTQRTRLDNARFFGSLDEVPWHVVTQGIATISDARHLVLVATGESKAEAIALTVEGPLAAVTPASALQLHPHATVIVDEAAASRLKHADYFRSTFAAKPTWQKL